MDEDEARAYLKAQRRASFRRLTYRAFISPLSQGSVEVNLLEIHTIEGPWARRAWSLSKDASKVPPSQIDLFLGYVNRSA